MTRPDWHLEMERIVAADGGLRIACARFLFLRHGETEHNKRRIIQPLQGVTLNETGRTQARNAGRKLASETFVEIHASDMPRAWETATIVSEACGRPLHPQPLLHERNWGNWAGQSNVNLDWGGSPEGGESLDAFTRRTLKGLNAVLAEEREVLIVAHGGNFAVLTAALGLPIQAASPRVLPNATPVRLKRDPAGPRGWIAEPLI